MNIKMLLVLFLVSFSTITENCLAQAGDQSSQVNPERFYFRMSSIWCSNEKILGCMSFSDPNCKIALEGLFSSCDSLVKASLEAALINAQETNVELPQIPAIDILKINSCLIESVLSERSIKRSDYEECIAN